MAINKNASLLYNLSQEADALASSAARFEFPVLLQKIAQRRRVTSVEFRPLLVDAMLTTHPSGFRILFNSEDKDAATLQARYEKETREQMLSPRLRFSLAHELAHTFFYDLSGGKPHIAKQFKAGGGRTALENLEKNCNRLASHLLLPTPMLKNALRKMKSISPESLIELAHSSGVSTETLVRRFGENSPFFIEPYFPGCIILAKETGSQTHVQAVARTQGLNIAAELQLIRSGERLQLADKSGTPIVPSCAPRNFVITFGSRSNLRKYAVKVAEVSRFNSVISSLVTLEETRTE